LTLPLLFISTVKADAPAELTIKPVAELVVTKKDILTKRQRAWFYALMWCESKANTKAVNPKDLDNTPSYGEFQFKPGTFNGFMKEYGLGTSTDYMDPVYQELIVEQMIFRNYPTFNRQFPDCVRKLGFPPKTLSTSQENAKIDKKVQDK
jgi:hypothetical protein